MKYSINLNLLKMQEHNLNVNQWCILDIISVAPTWCEIVMFKETPYFWISRTKILEELKALDLKEDTIYRHLKSLKELGFIEYEKDYKKDLIILTELGKSLFINSEINPNYYVGNKSEKNSEINPTYNNTNNNTYSTDYEAFSNLWNEFAIKNNKAKIAKLTDSRKKKIALRQKEYKNLLEIFTYVLKKSESSDFLLNGNFYTFDWLIENDTNILKVYEGKYDNEKPKEVII